MPHTQRKFQGFGFGASRFIRSSNTLFHVECNYFPFIPPVRSMPAQPTLGNAMLNFPRRFFVTFVIIVVMFYCSYYSFVAGLPEPQMGSGFRVQGGAKARLPWLEMSFG